MMYTLILTEAQAKTLSHALEIFARLGLGQFRDALEALPLRTPLSGWHDDMDAIRAMLRKHMVQGVDGYYSSLSMNSAATPEKAKIAWDLYQVVRRPLAWERAVRDGVIPSREAPRKWPEMMSVDYDEPMKTSTEPLATMERA